VEVCAFTDNTPRAYPNFEARIEHANELIDNGNRMLKNSMKKEAKAHYNKACGVL
jgi:hypothetical protein